MRLINADALIEQLKTDAKYATTFAAGGLRIAVITVDQQPTVEAVPLKPLAEWLAEYCTPICPPPPDAMLAIIDPARPITFTDITNAWEKALQTKIWEDDND